MEKAKFTPGPWRACNRGKCSCHTVWSVTADAPVCKVEHGEWGDSWPAIRIEPGIGGKAEAYTEFSAYGSIPSEKSTANVHLIAASPKMYAMLAEISDSVGTLLLDNDGVYLRDEIDKLLAEARGEGE